MDGSCAKRFTAPSVAGRDRAHAVWFPHSRAVEVREERLPRVGPCDVRIRALASAISHGTEMLVYRGQLPADLALDLPTLRGSFGFPIKYGYASVGRVLEVGAAVENHQTGDLVFTLHPHQTEYVVPASLPVRLPAGLAPERGVFTANVETAVNVMLDAAPRLGERIVIFGQGVVGLLLTQLARRAGASLVIAVEPLAARRKAAQAAGADVVLSPTDDLVATIRRLTDGIGADLAIEASGSSAALPPALDCVAFAGTIVVSSWYGAKRVEVPLGGSFHRGRLRIVSSQVGAIDPALTPRWSKERRLSFARDLLGSLQLAPHITHRIPFSHAAEAYELVDRHPEAVLQVVLTYGEDDPMGIGERSSNEIRRQDHLPPSPSQLG